MSVLRYCCFRWPVYDQALVFEPSWHLACNMILVWLILFVELCCDIFPWVPDLDHTRLRVWIVYGQIRGVTQREACPEIRGSFQDHWQKRWPRLSAWALIQFLKCAWCVSRVTASQVLQDARVRYQLRRDWPPRIFVLSWASSCYSWRNRAQNSQQVDQIPES